MKRSKRASQSHTVRDDPPGSVSRHRFSPYIGFYVKPVYLSSRSHLQKRLACLRARSSAETPRQESRVIITKFLTSKVHPEPTVLIPLPPLPSLSRAGSSHWARSGCSSCWHWDWLWLCALTRGGTRFGPRSKVVMAAVSQSERAWYLNVIVSWRKHPLNLVNISHLFISHMHKLSQIFTRV